MNWDYIAKHGGVDFNDRSVAIELVAAVNAGDAAANYILGQNYDVRNDSRAIHHYRIAAEQDYADAQNCLGSCYQKGELGLPCDINEAISWYQRAAKNGSTLAMQNLGLLYDAGNLVAKNDEISSYWYAKAAERGDALSQNNLACNYANGWGVPKNMDKAINLWIKSARGGYQLAIDFCRKNGIKY